MSLPGIFTPVRTKDAIYADGGLLQNIPVEVAKTMGADLTLAIHLAEAPVLPNASISAFSVLGDSI
jgi:NTE family protein